MTTPTNPTKYLPDRYYIEGYICILQHLFLVVMVSEDQKKIIERFGSDGGVLLVLVIYYIVYCEALPFGRYQ